MASGGIFRQGKNRLALDQYQIRSSKGIKRYWLLISLAHFISCTESGKVCSFEEGYTHFRNQLWKERIGYVYQCGTKHILFEEVLASVA